MLNMNRKAFIKKTAAFGAVLVKGDTIANSLTNESIKAMKKKITYKTSGQRADIGSIKIYRLLSNKHVDHVGHFVFLDYIPPMKIKERRLDPNAAHPHRGIATLSYILNGEITHHDSRGHKGTVGSGGVQWMKAANGIIHNEEVGSDPKAIDLPGHGFQFWINLPAEQKKLSPEYMAVQANELPLINLENNAGTLKVVVGEHKGQASKIPTYAKQYLYHITLKSGKQFVLPTTESYEYAAFLLQHNLIINNELCEAGYLIGFDDKGGNIEFTNLSNTDVEFILFGGEKYTEPYVAYGPFVMNTREEIEQAYVDYHSGKYGKMVYS